MIFHKLAFFFWLNELVKSVSSSSRVEYADESLGVGGERCAHISGIWRFFVSRHIVNSLPTHCGGTGKDLRNMQSRSEDVVCIAGFVLEILWPASRTCMLCVGDRGL